MDTKDLLGFVFGMLSGVGFGLFMVPRKHSNLDNSQFPFSMGIGVLIGTSVFGLFAGKILPEPTLDYALSLLAGAFWGIGTIGFMYGVHYLGLARSAPIKNTHAVLGTIFGVVIFHEFAFSHPIPLTLVLLGSAFMFVSAYSMGKMSSVHGSNSAHSGKYDPRTERRLTILGVAWSIGSAVGYSAYTIPMKIVFAHGMSPLAFLAFMGHGCFLSMAVLFVLSGGNIRNWWQQSWQDQAWAIAGGIMWSIASAFSYTSIKMIGLAVSWPLVNLNTLVAAAYGIRIFKEIDLSLNRTAIICGILSAVLGVIFLALALSGKI